MVKEQHIHEAKNKHASDWADIDGVEAVAVHEDHLCVDVSDDELLDGHPEIPDSVETPSGDVDVHFVLTGEFHAELPDEGGAERRNLRRPVFGGLSIAHEDLGGSGTSGFAAYDPDDPDQRYIISNNHVVANRNQCEVGDTVYQPAANYGGEPCGELAGWVEVENGVTVDVGWVDCEEDPDPKLYNIDTPDHEVRTRGGDFQTGELMHKTGLTTGVSSGQLEQKNATVNVNFGDPLGYVQIDGCLILERMSDNGDSGSPIIDDDGHIAALNFAGSSSATIACAADNIEAETGLKLYRREADVPDGDDPDPDPPETMRAEVTLELTPDRGNGEPDEGEIAVTLVDAESGDPITSANVSVEFDDGARRVSGDTGPEGKRTFTVALGVGPYTVSADPDGYEAAEVVVEEDDFE